MAGQQSCAASQRTRVVRVRSLARMQALPRRRECAPARRRQLWGRSRGLMSSRSWYASGVRRICGGKAVRFTEPAWRSVVRRATALGVAQGGTHHRDRCCVLPRPASPPRQGARWRENDRSRHRSLHPPCFQEAALASGPWLSLPSGQIYSAPIALFDYSAACCCTGAGRQRRTGLRAAAVSSSRRRGVRRGASRKLAASPAFARAASPVRTAAN